MKKCLFLAVLMIVLTIVNILVGSIHIPASDVLSILLGVTEGIRPSWQYIVLQSRLPQAITAVLAGGALAASGLMLQTAFRNPLADPGIFGISDGFWFRCYPCCCLLRCYGGDAGYLFLLRFSAFIGYVTHRGHYDWLCQ